MNLKDMKIGQVTSSKEVTAAQDKSQLIHTLDKVFNDTHMLLLLEDKSELDEKYVRIDKLTKVLEELEIVRRSLKRL